MVFDTNRWAEYDDPSMLLHRLTDRDGQTYYLLTGPEPDFQWERVVEAVRELVDLLGITLVVHDARHPDGRAAHPARGDDRPRHRRHAHR